MMIKPLLDLIIGMGRATLLGYGGGPAIVPLYQHEAVEVFHWMTNDEFGQMLALANALPGPLATKIGIYVGYKVDGWLGALVSLTAVVLPTGLAIIGMFALLHRFKDSPIVKGMTNGIRPVVFVMLAMLAWQFAKYAFQPRGTGVLSWAYFGLAGVYFVFVQYLHLNPLWGVITALVIGGIFLR